MLEPREIEYTGIGGRWGIRFPLPSGGKFSIGTDPLWQHLYLYADTKDGVIRGLRRLHDELGHILEAHR